MYFTVMELRYIYLLLIYFKRKYIKCIVVITYTNTGYLENNGRMEGLEQLINW